MQTSGLGGLRHNTVVLPWPQQWHSVREVQVCQQFTYAIRAADAADCAILVLKDASAFPPSSTKVRFSVVLQKNSQILLFSVAFLCRK